MLTLNEVEDIFKSRLTVYLQNEQFSQELWESLHTGYLSVSYIESLLIFNWSSSTRPRQVIEDSTRPTLFNMNIELGDFKADLENFRKAGIPAGILIQWVLDVTKKLGWEIPLPKQDSDSPPSPPPSRRID